MTAGVIEAAERIGAEAVFDIVGALLVQGKDAGRNRVIGPSAGPVPRADRAPGAEPAPQADSDQRGSGPAVGVADSAESMCWNRQSRVSGMSRRLPSQPLE